MPDFLGDVWAAIDWLWSQIDNNFNWLLHRLERIKEVVDKQFEDFQALIWERFNAAIDYAKNVLYQAQGFADKLVQVAEKNLKNLINEGVSSARQYAESLTDSVKKIALREIARLQDFVNQQLSEITTNFTNRFRYIEQIASYWGGDFGMLKKYLEYLAKKLDFQMIDALTNFRVGFMNKTIDIVSDPSKFFISLLAQHLVPVGCFIIALAMGTKEANLPDWPYGKE